MLFLFYILRLFYYFKLIKMTTMHPSRIVQKKLFKRDVWMHQKLQLTRTPYKYGYIWSCTLQELIINMDAPEDAPYKNSL